MSAPRILVIDYHGVYVHKNGPHQDEIESLEKLDWQENRLLTPKLKGTSYGEFKLVIGMINTAHFDAREKIDTLYSKDFTETAPISKVDRISLEEALKLLTVNISCNMEYYLSNLDEMEKDLDRKLKNLDPNNKEIRKELKAELFYKQAVKIFGEEASEDDVTTKENADQKSSQKLLTFKEFHLLFSDGNNKLATARRGSHYLLFFYRTS